jgi:hypothetical protein
LMSKLIEGALTLLLTAGNHTMKQSF